MRWVTYQSEPRRNHADRVGVVVDDVVCGLEEGAQLVELLGDDGERLAQAGQRATRTPAEVRPLSEVRLRAPIPTPPSIRDFPVFEQHVRSGLQALGVDLGGDWYEIAPFWFCNPNSVVGPDDLVEVPGNAHHMDFELEVAAVVGKSGRDLDPASADDYIVGFLIMNDWSARDLQEREMHCMPIGPSKGKDFATSLGPYLLTRDEWEPYRKNRSYDPEMRAWVNGRQYSLGNASDMYWGFNELLAFASRCATLRPGDVLAAGTCGSGCILELSTTHGEDAYPWLTEGDDLVLEIDGLGRLSNRITFGQEPKPLR
jgi:2-keto-4-pentenoate hydratase/2-oxohepta-3-ene-1,7-dioic acid hydratase in catechol pathway